MKNFIYALDNDLDIQKEAEKFKETILMLKRNFYKEEYL
jgi:hypothetical protein